MRKKAREILATCRRAMKPGATLLVIDRVIYGPNQPCESKPGDVAMMVRNSRRNRAKAEYRALLSQAGFELRTVSFAADGLARLAKRLGLLTAMPRA